MGNKVIKSVSFNVTVADDKAMLKHFSRKNFSGYVKKLILQDMKTKGVEVVEMTVKEDPPAVIPSAREQIEIMRQQRQQPAPPKLNLPKQSQ